MTDEEFAEFTAKLALIVKQSLPLITASGGGVIGLPPEPQPEEPSDGK